MHVFTVIEDGKGEKEHSEKIVWILLPKNIKMDKHALQFSMANCNLCQDLYVVVGGPLSRFKLPKKTASEIHHRKQ